MEQAFQEMLANENRHWWYRGRREILRRVIERRVGRVGRILEIGCGTGSNLRMLSAYGAVTGIETSPYARNYAAGRGFPVHDGMLPDGIPPELGTFDLVCMFDVLEHIGDDAGALRGVRRLLGPGGRLVVSVPAYQWLWSQHDVRLEHKRRYTRGRLTDVICGAGFKVRWASYFNSLLFLPAAAVRALTRFLPARAATREDFGASKINGLLYGLFTSEKALLDIAPLPFGLSVVAVAEA